MTLAPSTRLALLRAAERLFAEEGLDAVSLRRISVAAGQRNHSAVNYHFADKKDLINAILDRHFGPIEAGWSVAVPHLIQEGHAELRSLVSLLVRPLVAKLDDRDGGCEYILLVAELVTSRTFPILTMPATQAPGIMTLTAALMAHMESFPPELLPLRMMRFTGALYCSIADYRRLQRMGLELDRELFVDDLIDSLVSLLRQSRTRVE